MSERISRRFAVLPFLVALTALCVFPVTALKRASGQTPSRPLVIIYPVRLETGPKVIARVPGESDQVVLTMQACRSIRERIEDSNAVTGIIFAPESPLFQRAAQEAKITFGKRRELTSDEQVSIAKVAGAVYALAVYTQPVPDSGGSQEILISGINLENRKVWNDKVKFDLPGATKTKDGDVNAVRPPVSVQQSEQSQMSAANTLVTRLLAGPLGDYGRVAPPANLLPPPIRTAADTVPSLEAEAVQAAYEEADILLTQGDTSAAIVMLRRAVNQSPLTPRLRVLLTRAYIAAKRPNDAASEARRALQIAPPEDGQARAEMTRLLAEAFAQSGDRASARAAYEQVVNAQPSLVWPRLALAEIHLADGQTELAEKQYRAVLNAEPGNTTAAMALARMTAERGDYKAALNTLGPEGDTATPEQRAARHVAANALFDEFAPQLADLMARNRQAWEAKTLSREVFYKATSAQQNRVSALLSMLRAAPAPPSDAAAAKSHARRIHAASLLAQAATSLVNYLETGNNDSGSQASLWLAEFRRELAKAQGN